MSDEESEKPFLVEIAKQGRAVCKKCKQKCLQGELRLAKLTPNPFGSGKMKNWYHLSCMFEVFEKQRATTKRITDPDEDIDGWDSLEENYKQDILKRIEDCSKYFEEKHGVKTTPKKTKIKKNQEDAEASTSLEPKKQLDVDINHKDNSFREFRRLVAEITNISSYLEKTEAVRKIFTQGSKGDGFKGDVVLWCRLLLPGFVKRVYNIQSKQLVKLFSRIFQTSQEAMLAHLDQGGDVGETIQEFFEKSPTFNAAKKSKLTLREVDDFLEELSQMTKEEEQMAHLSKIASQCTPNDLLVIIRLIKHDLRMNAGAKHILDGVHPEAYQAYQSSRDIKTVIESCLSNKTKTKATIRLMTPVLPMLAEACKSVEQAMKKCPNGMYSEIKYDGERVQVHKQGSEFKYFSRSLKPVLPHKIAHFKDFIPDAFPHGKDLILDSEILMIDTESGKPLPFGTLGKHKKNEFENAQVCLFVFDCIYYNGEILTDKPLKHRKKILKESMTEIPNHIVFSELEEINSSQDLSKMIAKVLKMGLEGLVLKDTQSIYAPGKRHWLKVKKDYLFGGAMADSADLIVLGAWYGTGKKGGMMSVFLMGCYDEISNKFVTVTKVHTGHDDATLEKLQTELKMVKISSDITKVPAWLKCTKTMLPDFVARDPKAQPVWEITGAEFTQHDIHTADGISIRFPRVTKIRDDKTWKEATTLLELRNLYKKSKEETDVSLLKIGDVASKKRKLEENDKNETNKLKKVCKKVQIKNPLPNFFEGTGVIFDNDVKTSQPDLIRYYIAYGGTVFDENDDKSLHKITHMVHSNKTVKKTDRRQPNIHHVTIDWVKSSINSERISDFKPYTVYLKP